ETAVLANTRARSERPRIGAADLQRQRMLGWVIAQKARAIAMQHRTACEHFGIEQRATREQPMEEPAMPVGPFHHRSDTKSAGPILAGVVRAFSHCQFRLGLCRTISGFFRRDEDSH